MKNNYKLDEAQQQASQPASQIWVNANAGTGKTSILTARVLRLLLAGTPPHKILCLTYTRAGASEMQNRVIGELRRWVTLPEEALADTLESLMQTVPSAATLCRARQLFIEVLEHAEGLNVQTIHAFAQSLLRRFPVEAGVSPYFQLIDERQSRQMAEQVLKNLLTGITRGKWPELEAHVVHLATEMADMTLLKVLQDAMQNLAVWEDLFYHYPDPSQVDAPLAALLEMDSSKDDTTWQHDFFAHDGQLSEQLAQVLRALQASTRKDVLPLTEAIAARIQGKVAEVETVARYLLAFLTQAHEPRKLLEKLDVSDAIKSWLVIEARRVQQFVIQREARRNFRKSRAVLRLIFALLEHYQHQCAVLGVMDYQQLLMKAERLLTSESFHSGWVMYKLDGGVEHVLVDEAQDTSPAQWRIVQALASEFFSGKGRMDALRTLFVVGDEKQSIFSFQGADVVEFQRMKSWFAERSQHAGMEVHTIALKTSYRSSQQVIAAVNAITRHLEFAGVHEARAAAGNGRVVMWPVVSSEVKGQGAEVGEGDDGEQEDDVNLQLSKKITGAIAGWLDSRRVLECTGKPIEPRDIMVLVRKRSTLVQNLVRELKQRNIAVQGTDRQLLHEHLAVQDMLAFGRWLTLPEDDYSLACLLRSPIFGISEEALFALCYGRSTSLWEELKGRYGDALSSLPAGGGVNSDVYDASAQACVALLSRYLHMADSKAPYEIFYTLLHEDGVLARYIARMGVNVQPALLSFLEQAEIFESLEPASMQLFIQSMEHGGVEMKHHKSIENAVQIMTVHGAKGLEAPIVIMADAANAHQQREALLWVTLPEKAMRLPLYKSPAKLCLPSLLPHLEAEETARRAEYHRLLYVAMTRAKDALYITGAHARNSRYEASWYATLKEVLADIAEFPDDF